MEMFNMTNIENIETYIPLKWLYKTKIDTSEVYPNPATIKSGSVYRNDYNENSISRIYRSTRHTSSSVDINWLWRKLYDEDYFQHVQTYFLDNYVHADTIHLGQTTFNLLIKIRKDIATQQNLLKSVINKAFERRKLKKRFQVYRSLLFGGLNQDVIGEIQKYI
jgi:hypothetical protein